MNVITFRGRLDFFNCFDAIDVVDTLNTIVDDVYLTCHSEKCEG